MKNYQSSTFGEIMNDRIKKLYKIVKRKVNDKPYLYGFICILVLALIPIFIWLAFFLGNCGYVLINTSMTIDGAFQFYGSILAFIGTISLGMLAFWQNKRFKKENDKSQKKIMKLTAQSNNTYNQLLKLEKDKFRPYISIIDKTIFFTVGEQSTNCLKFVKAFSKLKRVYIKGNTISNEKSYEQLVNSIYPVCLTFIFTVQNIGQAAIAHFCIKRFLVLDSITGSIKGFMSSIDTTITPSQKIQIVLSISTQIPIQYDENGDLLLINKIYNYYEKKINEIIRASQIEVTIAYSDIYGRKYEQEYSIQMQYDLNKRINKELIFKTSNLVIEHHIGKSPYGPRLDEIQK